MINARPNALSLAVAIALSSSIISTQAMTERKLQTKSLDISNEGHLPFTQSLVSVQPTLAGDQQPIPKSFTTTYLDQTQAREGYTVPSDGFTDILSAVSADVTSVDLFETGENDVAQKYTKVLKVGDEEVFKFTHSLEERELIIEVRGGMTDQETVEAVRDQLTVIPSLEPSTKIARPEQLHAVLEGADDRAGYLGTSDHYVALATIKVEPVEVNGRTFMRLIASGDQTPELNRLTQSLFVNDEALLAAATSAYIQVHVLKEELQQEALDGLLALSKPVGYVMQSEDSKGVYPAPSGYPKLVPSHTQEDTIVFYSQKLNPADIAFVENLYNLLAEAEPDGLTHATTKVKTYRVKSYQHVIRSRQWALLEELAARGDTEFGKEKLTSLAYYESLQQALASATPLRADEFELTLEHLKVTSSVLTPTWIHYQLVKYFGFYDAMKTLLTDQRFIQDMEELIPFIRYIHKVQTDTPGDEEFTSRVLKGMSVQMINTYNKMEAMRTKEGDYNRLLKRLEDNAKENIRALELSLELRQKAEHELAQSLKALEELQNRSQKLQQEVERIPALEKQVLDARADASKVYNSQLAKKLGIDNWDNTQPTEQQARIIIKKIDEINQMVSTTGKADFYKQAMRTEMAAIETIFHITPVDKDDLSERFRAIYEQLLQKSELAFKGAQQTLAMAEDKLGLRPDNDEDLIARFRSILELLRQMGRESARQLFQDQQGQEEQKNQLQKLQQEAKRIPELEQKVHDARTDATKDRNAQTAAELGIDDWDDTLPLEEQARLIRKKIQAIKPSVAAAEEPDEETVKAKPAGTGKKDRIILVDEDQLATLLISHEQLQQNPEQPDEEIREKLSDLEDQLGLVPNKEDDLQARHQNILKHLEQEAFDVSQRELRKRKNRLEKLLQTGVKKLVDKADTVPKLQKQLLTVRRIARQSNYAHTAARLGIDDWDDTLPFEEQQRLIEEKINDIYRSMAATGQPDEEAVTGEPAAISSRRGIASVNKNNPATLLLIQKRLQGNTELADEEVREKLTIFEDHLGLVPENIDDLKARHRTIQQHLKQQITEILQQPFQNQQQQEDKRISELKRQVLTARADATKVRNAQLAAELGMEDWDDTRSPEEQARLIREKVNEMKPSVVTTGQSDEETLEAEPSAMQIEEENQLEKLVQKADMVPKLEQKIATLRNYARMARYAHTAAKLGMDDWDELLPLEEQHRLIEEKINDIYRSMAATGQPDEEAVTTEPAPIVSRRGIASVNKNNPGTLLFIQQQLQKNTELADEEVREKLTAFESHLGLVPENNDDLKARHRAIQQHLKQQVTETAQQPFQNQQQQEDKRISELEQQVLTARADATKVRNAQLAAELGMEDWDDTQSSEEQARLIREKINEIKPSVATTGQSDEETVKAKPPTISQKRGITSVDEEDPAALHFTPQRQRLEQNEELPYAEILERLNFFENKLGLVPENEDDPEVRLLSLHQGIQKESRRVYLQHVENQEELAKQRNWLQFLQNEVNRITIPKKEARESLEENRKNYNIQLAAALEIDDWDDTQPLEQQDSLIRQKIRGLKQPATEAQITASSMTPTTIAPTPVIATSLVTATLSVTTTNAATAHTPQEALKETLAAIESRHNITPDDENDLVARCRFVQQYLQQKHAELTDFSEVENKLAWIEGQLGLAPDIESDPEVRCQTIKQHLGEQNAQIAQQQQYLQQQYTGTETEIEAEIKARYATIAAHLNIENFDSDADIGDQQKYLLQELEKLNLQQDLLLSKMKQQFPDTREEDYGDVAGIDEKNSLIEAKLKQLDAEIFKARQLEVNVRIAAIDDELDRQMARLGPKPRDVLDRDLTMTRQAILVAENKLAGPHRKLNDLPGKKLAVMIGNDVPPVPDGDDEVATKNLNTRIEGQKIHETRQSVTVKSIASTPLGVTPLATASIASTPLSATTVATVSIAPTPVSATPAATASIASTAHYQEENSEEKLTAIESRYDITPDNEPEVLHQAVKRDLMKQLARLTQQKQHLHQDLQQLLQQQSTGTETETEAEMKARFATIAEHSNIEGFDSNANIDVQQELLIQKFEEINAQEQGLRQQLYTMANQQDIEHSYTLARKDALAAVIGLDRVPEDRAALELIVRDKLFQLAELEQELEDIRTPGHPKAMSEVLRTLRAAEKALNNERLTEEQDVYFRRMDISINMRAFIREARQRSEEDALMTLSYLENLFNIKTDKDDYKAARLKSVLTRLDDGDISNYQLDQLHMTLWPERYRSRENLEQARMDFKLFHIRDRLTFIVKESDKRAIEKQADYLFALENELNIDPDKNPAAKTRGKTFLAKLASDLQIEFDDDDSKLSKQYALRNRIQKLRKEVNEIYDDEGVRRIKNNRIAEQLGIKDYGDDAGIDEQNSLIEAKLEQLEAEFFKAVQLDVNERIAAIDDELDRQMARLGPKPRYVLDRDLAMARRAIPEAENKLAGLHRKLNDLRRKKLAVIIDNDVHPAPDEDDEAAAKNLNTRIKGDLGSLEEIQEQTRLEGEIETQKADIVKLKEALNTAEKAVISDGGPFQYTPDQVKVLNAIHKFTKQHPLKKQALEAAIGLIEAVIERGKSPLFTSFDFDDEFAAIRLQAMIGDELTFEQAGRIVEIFNDLKATFPESPSGSVKDRPHSVLEEIELLACRARMHLETGAREYDVEIRGMGLAGIHYFEQEPGDLKSFSEYFATRSASGNKIIALLREGLISKIELGNYMKAVRGVDGYQTVDEFEHFLGYKHGIRVSHFKAVVQMLSDQGVEELIQSAFTPVTLTATGPAGMKESVVGMTEYAAAVVANYVLDDIAFDNGRRTAAFLTNIQDTLTPYANVVGMSESDLIKIVHDTLMQAHAEAVKQQLNDYWAKPSAFLVQAVTWYYSSYKPLLATHSDWQAAKLSLANMSFLYLLDLTNRGDYLHRMLTPFQHWLERYAVDLDRTGQYAYHSGIEQISEVGGLAMPLGKAASSVILLRTGSALFTRQYNANPHRYRSISRLVPEIVKSMGSGQGVQVPLLNRVTPQKVKTLASATAGLVLGPIATAGAYAHGLISGFTYAQTFGFALASSLTFDFFMNDNKMLTQWLGGPLGRSLDRINRWRGVGETQDEYVKRTAIATPQRHSETDEEYANRVKANNTMYGWTRHENYLQFRERRDRTMKLFENSWEKYFRENVPKWSFSHAESIPYSYTLGAYFESETERGNEL